MVNPTSVAFRHVAKVFTLPGSRDLGVIGKVTFDLIQGTCLSLVGGNGSGKSTILRIACGLVSPSSGTLSVLGGNPATEGSIRARISAMFEGGRSLYGRLTPLENIHYFSSLKGFRQSSSLNKFDELCERFRVTQYRDIVIQKLSRGTQQKISLLCSLATKSDLWVLDEPTLGLDAESVSILATVLHEHLKYGGSTLMATHELQFAEAAGTVVNMTEFHAAAAGGVSGATT